MKLRITLSLNNKIVEMIDSERGIIPRSTYVDFLLRKILEEENESFFVSKGKDDQSEVVCSGVKNG